MKTLTYAICIFTLTFLTSKTLNAQVSIDFESGAVFTGSNDVRIPGDKGTLFSLTDDLETDAILYYRLRASYTFNSRHTFSLLYAPLETESKGVIGRDILFEDKVFQRNTTLNNTYKFNSYRLTYRYTIVNRPKLVFGLGFTAKIRDAKISLSSSNLSAEKTNVGFVPIINFRLWWKPTNNFGLLLDGDALAAPQGRAIDAQIAGTYKLSNNIGLRAGYRILEGGADNDEVYNFSLFHYASLGVTYTFNFNK